MYMKPSKFITKFLGFIFFAGVLMSSDGCTQKEVAEDELLSPANQMVGKSVSLNEIFSVAAQLPISNIETGYHTIVFSQDSETSSKYKVESVRQDVLQEDSGLAWAIGLSRLFPDDHYLVITSVNDEEVFSQKNECILYINEAIKGSDSKTKMKIQYFPGTSNFFIYTEASTKFTLKEKYGA